MTHTTTAHHQPQTEPLPQPSGVRKATKKHWFYTWPVWLVSILSLLIALAIYLVLTHVTGIELNTHTWEQREFSLHRDPLTGWQITGVRHNVPQSDGWWSTVPNPHAKKIPADIGKYLPRNSVLPVRWDLVRVQGTNLPGGAASILVRFLDAQDRGYQDFWPQWSINNPQRAAVVWPAAHQLVEFEQYTQLPALFDLALLDNSLPQLTEDVGQLVQTSLWETCQQHMRLANYDLAHWAAEVGLQYGEQPELRKMWEQSASGSP